MGVCVPFLTVVRVLPPNGLDLDWRCFSQNHRDRFAFFLFLLAPGSLVWGYSLMRRPFRGGKETPSWARLSSKVVQPGPRHWIALVSLILLWVTVSANTLCDVMFQKHERRLSWGARIAPPFMLGKHGWDCRPSSWGWGVIESCFLRPQKKDCLFKIVLYQLWGTLWWIPLGGGMVLNSSGAVWMNEFSDEACPFPAPLLCWKLECCSFERC